MLNKMIRSIVFLVLLGMFSCNESPLKEQDSNSSLEKTISEPAEGCKPSQVFLSLLEYMDSSSYSIDTSTISSATHLFENIKVNREEYSETFIHELLSDSSVFEEGSAGLASVNYNPKYDSSFSKVSCIWSYSWRIPDTQDGLKRKGTVEEWVFDTESTAKFAYEFLINEQRKIGFPFCKTPAFYVQSDRYLYLFHSDNSGVGYRNKPFYEWLKKRVT
ncbi:MAG: hypothetical protein RL204_1025 [Bacteroidota bacterium]|jgi:hypothetical protein